MSVTSSETSKVLSALSPAQRRRLLGLRHARDVVDYIDAFRPSTRAAYLRHGIINEQCMLTSFGRTLLVELHLESDQFAEVRKVMSGTTQAWLRDVGTILEGDIARQVEQVNSLDPAVLLELDIHEMIDPDTLRLTPFGIRFGQLLRAECLSRVQ